MKEMPVKLESFCPEPKEWSFFKIFLPHQLSTQHLRIPPKFVKRLSKESFEKLILEDPSGKHWNVKLCKTADGIYITDGWQAFAKEHSLWNYEFLVFIYDGDMCFKVMIFDKTGCKRDYITSTTHQEPISPVVRMEPEDEPASEKFVSNPGKKQGRGRHQEPPFSPAVIKEPEDGPAAEEKFVSNPDKKHGRGRPPKKSTAAISNELSLRTTTSFARKWDSEFQASIERRKYLNEEEQKELWKAVGSFTSSLPYLVRRLDRINLTLYIPVDFSNAYLPRGSTQITLRNLNGKAWTVDTFMNGRGYTFVRKGWKDFVHENHIRKGDICIFELASEYEFRVHTFWFVK